MALIRASARKPPAFFPARILLKLLVGDPHREFLLGDLEEIYREKTRCCSPIRAQVWLWQQTLLALCYWTRYRLEALAQAEKDEEQSMFAGLRKDLFYAVRLALKRPGFSVVVILTLALGIGANTAVYSLTAAFMFRQLPVPQAERMVSIFRQSADGTFKSNLSYAQIQDYDEQSQTLVGVLGFSLVRASLNYEGLTEMIFGEAVTGNYFDLLEVSPQLGRTFVAEEYRSGGQQPVVVISNGLWQRRFGSAPGISRGHAQSKWGRLYRSRGHSAQLHRFQVRAFHEFLDPGPNHASIPKMAGLEQSR